MTNLGFGSLALSFILFPSPFQLHSLSFQKNFTQIVKKSYSYLVHPLAGSIFTNYHKPKDEE